MNVEEAIVSALVFEHNVRDHYYEASRRTDDPKAKEIFSLLGQEEQGHVDFLESRLQKWRTAGKLDKITLKSILPSRAWVESGEAKLHDTGLDRDYTSELQMLKDALQLEEEVSDHYKLLVASLDGDAQQMFRRFLEIEDGHAAIVQAEIDTLQGTGFWFSIPEFDLEAG